MRLSAKERHRIRVVRKADPRYLADGTPNPMALGAKVFSGGAQTEVGNVKNARPDSREVRAAIALRYLESGQTLDLSGLDKETRRRVRRLADSLAIA